MLEWFETRAGLRTKFTVLLVVLTSLSLVSLITTVLAASQHGGLLIAIAEAATAGTIVTINMASRRICTPYVTTVRRMEALARGDVDAEIRYTDYTECVGRMANTMLVFRDNAIEVRNRRLSREVTFRNLSDGLTRLAHGELDIELTEIFPNDSDSLRQNFNAAIAALCATITAVRATASSVFNAATEIRAASDDLAMRNEQQAASLEETAAAMDQVTGIVKDTATSAAEVQRAISSTHQEASEGGLVVRQAIGAMGAIERSSKEISQIVNVIDGISFQTNLLALNAGVEAARAGDAGKGFAVVANEVRALAQRSADAAKDIKNLITTSSEQVASGVTLVGETGALLTNIVERVGEVSVRVGEIARAAENQAINLIQVNSSVGEMDRMTQQNAAMVEQSTAAARSLADEAGELTQLVSRFRTGEAAEAAVVSFPTIAKAPAGFAAARGRLARRRSGGDDWSAF